MIAMMIAWLWVSGVDDRSRCWRGWSPWRRWWSSRSRSYCIALYISLTRINHLYTVRDFCCGERKKILEKIILKRKIFSWKLSIKIKFIFSIVFLNSIIGISVNRGIIVIIGVIFRCRRQQCRQCRHHVPRWREYGSLSSWALLCGPPKKAKKNFQENFLKKSSEKMTWKNGQKSGRKMASRRTKNHWKNLALWSVFLTKKSWNFSQIFPKNFCKIFDMQKNAPRWTKNLSRSTPVSPTEVWNFYKKGPVEPFFGPLVRLPPSHNFFQTGFRPKFSSSEKFLCFQIPKSALFCIFLRMSGVS